MSLLGGQRRRREPQGRMVPLLLVISPRPERLFSGRIREFVKGLAQELGTGPAPVHPAHLAARRSDGSDAGELLNLFGALIAVAVRAERGGQARAQGFSGAGQAVKELLVGVLAEEFFQRLIEAS